MGSPRKARPKTATCSTSVFEYATPSAKLRSRIVLRRSAVAAICVTQPSSTQPKNAPAGEGTAAPDPAFTRKNHAAAKGTP